MTSRTYRSVAKARERNRLDQSTWARNSLLFLSYDTIGTGEIETELIDFGLVFEDKPFFAYGVELQPNEALIAGQFPSVMCGVREWQVTEVERDARAIPLYIGAFLWISIVTNVSYRLRFRLSFEGISMRNVEHFR